MTIADPLMFAYIWSELTSYDFHGTIKQHYGTHHDMARLLLRGSMAIIKCLPVLGNWMRCFKWVCWATMSLWTQDLFFVMQSFQQNGVLIHIGVPRKMHGISGETAYVSPTQWMFFHFNQHILFGSWEPTTDTPHHPPRPPLRPTGNGGAVQSFLVFQWLRHSGGYLTTDDMISHTRDRGPQALDVGFIAGI